MSRDLLVFDMDGVLVEVTESYRESIVQTVLHFTGKQIERDSIQDYKNAGGWNNDWALSQKICADLGHKVEYGRVVEVFQQIFFGKDGVEGLMQREQWIAEPGLLARLAQRFQLAIFTGRLREEAEMTLRRFADESQFAPIISDEDVLQSKPAPDGLLAIAEQFPGAKMTYIGDTVDDARSARAASVPFIGIASRSNPRHHELVTLLKLEKAIAVLDNINELESVR
ncbi:MAG: HAD-IA family hydrolase [Bryobacteraceae bacterium]